MNERLAVIGSNSFSGAQFVDVCVREGLEVLGLSRSSEPIDAFLPYRWHSHPGSFRFEQSDLNQDLDRIIQLLKAFKPAYVVNFAAQGMVAESWENPDHWYQTNVLV